MKRIILFSLFLSTFSVLRAQDREAYFHVEKFKDSLDNSVYPILYFEASIKPFAVTYWSNLQGYIYPYVNIYFTWRNWYISWNPLKTDEYNPKIQITFNKILWLK